MVSSGFAGALAALQIRVFFDHMLPKPLLPLCQLLLIAYDILGTEPPVLCQWDKRKVHMGRFLVHMHHGGYNCFLVLVFPDEIQRLLKIGFDFSFLLTLEELRRCGHKSLHQPHAVRTGAATGVLDLPLCLCTIFALRFEQVEIQVAAALVNVGIAGVVLFCALIVRLNIRNSRSFVLCKAENRKLRLTHLFLPPFLPRRRKLHILHSAASGRVHPFRCSSSPHKGIAFARTPVNFISQCVGKLDDLFIADALPLQLGGQIGNAVRPAIFIIQQVNNLLHRKTGTNDLRLDFIAYTHIQIPSIIR